MGALVAPVGVRGFTFFTSTTFSSPFFLTFRYFTISLGGQEKRKNKKTRKSRSEEKVEGFGSASLFLVRKREVVTQGGTMELGG